MKKILIGLLVFVILLIVVATLFCITTDVNFGKQHHLKTSQDKNFEESNFYKEYYSKDKLTVLNLWATWCVPCVQEIPDLNAVRKNYKNNSLNFISSSFICCFVN